VAIELGNLRIDVLSDGEFRLDGGAMFGMVPRERWKEWCPPDERNRIRLQTHGLLVRGPDFVLVVEPGIAEEIDRDLFAVTKKPTLESSLAEHGVSPEGVTHVTCTHLHFDHAGGGDRFPNATYLVQRREWETANSPHLLHSRSYRSQDLPPEDRLVLVEGEAEPLPGVALRLTGGHTPGHQVVIFEDRAIFWGDLLPTVHHLSPPRTMAYDFSPLDVVDAKILLMGEAARKDWVCFLYHDLDPRPARITADGKRFLLKHRESFRGP